VLVLAVLVNIAGIGIRFFTDDPALYSLIARHIAKTNDFTDLIYRGHAWLDKPHFPFWIVAVSFKLFGVNTIAYKLPALLFFFMSVIYTYKLAKKFYDSDTALVAILILLTSQHIIMSNTDVRAEPYIMGLLMGGVYHFCRVKERFSWLQILLASLMAACAVMTKGIYLLIPTGFAIAGDYLFKKDIKALFQWKWLLAIILTIIFTLPELYTLYVQFDLHPEKVVFGRTGVSGIHWFLWDSQFGRFNNNTYIRNTHGDVFFFLHTLLWAYAPWAIVFFYALFKSFRRLFKGIAQPEYLCFCGGIPMLIIFSVSKFQLPFYTNILFPFFSIITAVFIRQLVTGRELKFFKITQYTLNILLLIFLAGLSFLFAPEQLWIAILLIMTLAVVAFYIYRSSGAIFQSLFLFTCCVVICVNAYVMAVVYPTLANYRSDNAAAAYLNKNYPDEPVMTNILSNRLNFYRHGPLKEVDTDEILKLGIQNNELLLIDKNLASRLIQRKVEFSIIRIFDNYPKENLALSFLIESKRGEVLQHYYLIKTGD
jgi:4-amino-4-deoxy-L-arabinose transferase-like glycosyltransferase